VAVAHRAAFSFVCLSMQSVPCPWPLEEREKEDRFHQTPPLTEPRCCPPSIRPNRSISRLSHCRPGWLRALYFYYTFLCLYFMHSTHRRCGACAVFLQPILSTWLLLPAAAGLKTRYHATGRTSSPWLDFRPSTENVMFATGQGSPTLCLLFPRFVSAVFCIWGSHYLYILQHTLKIGGEIRVKCRSHI
jgi:hypothetical protein